MLLHILGSAVFQTLSRYSVMGWSAFCQVELGSLGLPGNMLPLLLLRVGEALAGMRKSSNA